MALNTMQLAILVAVNLGDDQGLQHLQTCTNELFRRAELCRREGKQMAITDEHQGDETLH